MGIKKQHFCLKIKQHNTPYLSFSHRWHPLTRETRSDEFWVFSNMAHHSSLSTFQDGGRVEFPTLLGIAADVKIPTHVRLTKSNSPGLPDPPILGQTIDRCIRSSVDFRNWDDKDNLSQSRLLLLVTKSRTTAWSRGLLSLWHYDHQTLRLFFGVSRITVTGVSEEFWLL